MDNSLHNKGFLLGHIDTVDLRARLGEEAWDIVACGGTEPPFRNRYWDNHAQGLYLDAVDGTALFASTTKFDSGTGWPSFFEPVAPDRVTFIEDVSYGMRRIEVRSARTGAHLGHVFPDGPEPTHLRYCINSGALRFVSLAELDEGQRAEFEAALAKASAQQERR